MRGDPNPPAASPGALLEIDRKVKGPLYRKEGVLEYWIVNLEDGVLEVQRRDEGGVTRVFRPGETIAPVAFPDAEFAVDDVLGHHQ